MKSSRFFPASLRLAAALSGALAFGLPVEATGATAPAAASSAQRGLRPLFEAMLTPAEQAGLHDRMATFGSFEECHAYLDDLFARVVVRGRQSGVAVPGAPAHDPCERFPRLKP